MFSRDAFQTAARDGLAALSSERCLAAGCRRRRSLLAALWVTALTTF
jgi:hypothetical protein